MEGELVEKILVVFFSTSKSGANGYTLLTHF